jgi:acyl-CoA reductase-like NAD-dependent aldehyde dehydrogenase
VVSHAASGLPLELSGGSSGENGGGVAAPFGGYKKSGFGRGKSLEALEHYTQVKNVNVAIN